MINKIFAFAFLLFFTSCVGTKVVPDLSTDLAVNEFENPFEIYFKANNKEAFWDLEITNNKTKLKTKETLFIARTAPFVRTMNSNIIKFRVENKSHEVVIKIIESESRDSISGVFPLYKVIVESKNKNTKVKTIMEGYGHYPTDYRLHDIWSLMQLKGVAVKVEDYDRQFPYIEINSTNNFFYGYSGCNQMSGQISFKKESLQFVNFKVEDKKCPLTNHQNNYLSALKTVTNYKVENNRLILYNKNGVQLLFKKVD